MFSEYASKFLAQSQSRLSNFGQQDYNSGDAPTNNHDQQGSGRGNTAEWPARGSRYARPFLGRIGNPYLPQAGSGSRFGGLNFASRYSSAAQEAPLFHSGRGDLQEEDEEEERDREHADFSALQRSRRVFAAAGRLDESSEVENDESRASLDQSGENEDDRSYGQGGRRGIRSSWNGTRSFYRRARDPGSATAEEEAEDPAFARKADNNPLGRSRHDSDSSKGKMVDVGLESTVLDDDDNEPPADLTMETPVDKTPPAFQQFKSTGRPSAFSVTRRESTGDSEAGVGFLRQDTASTAPTEAAGSPPERVNAEIFEHDPFFAWLYLIAFASMLATFVLVYLHTSTPSRKKPMGDTIYTTLLASFHLLAVDTLVAIIVSLVWLAALRNFARPLIWLIIIAVPTVLLSFSLYPFVSSYQGREQGNGLQDSAMRWASVLPGVGAVFWLYMVWNGRGALLKAMQILEFSSRILAANQGLYLVGLACLGIVVVWTWLWLAMFTRVFLGGYFSGSAFILQASTWWLGVWFVLMYIWTLSVVSGVQRGTTAATVSQWYFHRNVVPAPSSTEVVAAALGHSSTTIFGSICLSTLLALIIRLPLLVLPRRISGLITMFFYSFMPTSIAAQTNPLTLTYAAIHSMDLGRSARGLSQLDFLSPDAPTTTLTPRAVRGRAGHGLMGGSGSPLLPYRLAKLLLHATRFIMATALGFAGWVMTARQLSIDGGKGLRGSAYAYVVGLVASFIGWGVLGAMEGVLSGIVDGAIICYGSETRMAAGAGRYCMEAANLFGDRRAAAAYEEEQHGVRNRRDFGQPY